jgi:hypothetical protein
MKNFLADKLDLFSSKPELKVQGNSKFRTKFGIVVGIISIILLITIYIFYILQCVLRKEKIVTYNEKRNITPRIALNNNKISLSIFDGFGRDYPDQDRLLSLSARYWKSNFLDIPRMDIDYIKNEENLGKIIDIPLKKCNKFSDQKFSKEFAQLNFLKPNSVCLELDGFKEDIFGRYGSLSK